MAVKAEKVAYELLGTSAAVRDCAAQVERAAAEDRGVLITAEPGLDDQAIARAIHGRGARHGAPFVVLACGGAAPADLERALFGAQSRGGAASDLELVAPAGALMRADGGVLFLSALHELPAPLQRRLARVLRDGEVRVARRAGAITLDVRVIGSRENSLDNAIREDLIRRLPAIVDVPPLRQRRADVPAIAEAMLAARDESRRFTPAALTVLGALPWRRNTAELSRLIDRLTAGGAATPIRQEDVLAEVQLDLPAARPAGSLRDARRQFERDYIAAVLRQHEWHMPEAARALGIERANLYRKARQLGIPLRRGADAARERVAR
jgi:DNA-binding NtrC family response regulator